MLDFFKSMFSSGSDSELEAIIKNGAYLVDVRTPQEFQSGSVKGAVNFPLNQLQGQLAKLKNKDHIVVFCQSGNRSGQAKAILNQNGFNNVTNGGSWHHVKGVVEQLKVS